MNTNPQAAGLAAQTVSSSASLSRNASLDGRSQRKRPLMRKYEIAHLNASNNDIVDLNVMAPALPAFEDAFACFGRGAILQTDMGPCAIEDLLPGDAVQAADGHFHNLLWKGAMTIVPGSQNTRPAMGTMTRITSDAMGFGRPMPDLVLGPAARMRHRAHGIHQLTGHDTASVPVRDFIDQSQIIELTPAAPVQVYQLGFDAHVMLNVNGIEIESLHPGLQHTLGLKADTLSYLMTLFPHKRDFQDFGPMVAPRINLRDLDLFAAA